jgi:hypothetical protein
MNLDEIGLKHGTDKASNGHDYLRTYESIFGHRRQEALTILELGINEGRSLRTWNQYFPNARILGVDIDKRSMKWADDRIETFLCDVSKPAEIAVLKTSLPSGVDYIIDDASHHVDDIIIAHQNLCSLINPGGAYIIEDTSRAFLEVREHPARGNRFQGTRMIDYFGQLIASLNGDGRPNTHNVKRMQKEGYPVSPIESIEFQAEMLIIKYRE